MMRWALLPLAGLALILGGCQSASVGPNDFGTWSFTGFVIDGSSKTPLEGANILYADKDGAEKKAVSDAAGAFVISSLPFGERNFKFSYASSGSGSPAYTEKLVVMSSLNESRSIEGEVANVSMVVSLYPLSGSVSGTLAARLPGNAMAVPAGGVAVKLVYKDTAVFNSAPIVFDTVTDAKGRFSLGGLPLAPGASVIFNNFTLDGALFALAPVDIAQLFPKGGVDLGPLYLIAKDSSATRIQQVKSSVLSTDGFGLPSVPVDQTLYYVLPVAPKAGTMAATLEGGKAVNTRLTVSKDTLFIDPVGNLPFDTLVTVTVSGLDTAGNQILFVFDGVRRFRTEKGIYPVESNAWDRVGQARKDFRPDDTLWVRFSSALDPDVNKITWSKSSADNSIFGAGAQANAQAWVDGDTLFVRGDQRLAVQFAQTMGFNVNVLSKDGKRSDSLDVSVRVIADKYYVKWTNTKDALGNMRVDFGPTDSVMLVSSSPISEIRGLSAVTGKTAPPDLFLDNVRLRGDTIVYKPSLYLKTDSTYGIDFDVLFADQNFRRHVLAVSWKTVGSVQMLSFDNRQDGQYRPLRAIGDSLTVVFSNPIDTSLSSPVPFRVNMTDVNGQPVRSNVRWQADRRTAVIRNIDTLPTADFDASPAYTEDAVNTRAVASVTFDLMTVRGEKVFRFKPANRDLQIHTERGLALVDANILAGHDRRTAVKRTETAVTDFDMNGSVVLNFSRELDTAAIRADTVNAHFQIRTVTDTVKASISFSADAKTVTLTPAAALAPNTDYRVWAKDVPAAGISGAAPIDNHGGTFSGSAINNSVLDNVFRTRK